MTATFLSKFAKEKIDGAPSHISWTYCEESDQNVFSAKHKLTSAELDVLTDEKVTKIRQEETYSAFEGDLSLLYQMGTKTDIKHEADDLHEQFALISLCETITCTDIKEERTDTDK
jgi:hypothetical protein